MRRKTVSATHHPSPLTAHVLFVSDLHLCPTRPETVEVFLRFLEQTASRAEALYILGDLFEYWIGDDDLDDPFNARIVGALAKLSQGGTRLFLIRGNRDFLQGDAFAKACGGIFFGDPGVADLYGTPTLLCHGDILCTDDREYQDFRALVRDPAWQARFLARPLAERRREIEALRARSEAGKRTKAPYLMEVNQDAVIQALRHHDCRRLIHGHTHRVAHYALSIDGRPGERWVLGAWGRQGDGLRCAADGCMAFTIP